VCCSVKTKSTSYDNQDKETSTHKVQGENKKIWVGAKFSAPVQTGPVAYAASYKMGIVYLS
jgi:hypothetical protein